MIHIDEAQFKLQSQDYKRDKVTRQMRCDAQCKYKKGAGAVSLIMGISGDEQNPFEFSKQYSSGGNNCWQFYNYMAAFIEWLNTNRPGRACCFTMDNLNIHKSPIILDLVEDAGHIGWFFELRIGRAMDPLSMCLT